MSNVRYGIILEQSVLLRELDHAIHESFQVHGQETNIHLGNFGGKDVLVGCGRTSPLVAILIETYSRCDVSVVFRIATSGSLQSELQEGDVILCTDAIRGEGTSNCYIEPNFPAVADFALTCQVARELEQSNIPYKYGTIWTTDGRFVETDELVQKYRKSGVLAIDMESSAFFLVSKLKGIRATCLSIVADAPWKELGVDLKGSRSDERYYDKILPSMKRCLETICSLIARIT